jgi:phospholipase C
MVFETEHQGAPHHRKGAAKTDFEFNYFKLAVAVLFCLALSLPGYCDVTFTPPCALNSINRTVTFCSVRPGATVSSPLHIVAATTDSNTVQSIQLLLDGQLAYQASAGQLDIYLNSLSAGAHTIVVKAQDSAGVFSRSLRVTVTANSGLQNIRHIIYLVQENHSFDNYFGMLGRYRASKGLPNGVDGVPLNATEYSTSGQAVHPYHLQTVCVEGIVPSWGPNWKAADLGKMDGFVRYGTTIDPQGTRAMGYYDQTDLPYYYELATQFGTSDRWFSPVMSSTNPNRMYLFAATSFGHIDPDQPPTGGWPQPTIFDHLDQAGVSWWYYYQDNGVYLPQWQTYQRDASRLRAISNWYTDIQNEATLPQVIFIERAGPSGLDEHPYKNIQAGAANTAKILNALLASPSWASSVFILTYDEGGAGFDHVIPATTVAPDDIPPMLSSSGYPGDFKHTGFRVPMIVVSPWSKPNFVSHTWRDYTSILRLIEDRFGVAPLTARDAAADNMMEFFNFSTPHWLTPPPLPQQLQNKACDYNLEKAPGF